MAQSKIDKARTFAAALSEKAGDNLVSLILYGSQARAGYAQTHADVNLFLILKDASTEALRPVEPLIAEWARKQPPPLIVAHADWRASTDVFAIEMEDMRDAHEILAGGDPFDGLEISNTDLRHELERELRGKLLQLRSQYAAVAPDGKRLTRLLLDSVGTFFVLMRAFVRLVGGTPDASPEQLVGQVAKAAELDADAFDWVVRKISGQTVRSLQPYDPVGARYVDAIESLARFVDTYTPTRASTDD